MDPGALPIPLPAIEIDRRLHLRKGTCRRAIEAGRLRGCMRRGRGGLQAWVMPADVELWFFNGLPTEPEAKP